MTVESMEQAVRRLVAIEDIRQLKARYFRCVDFRLWDEFADLFTDDLIVDFAESTSSPRGKQEFLASVARHFETGYSVHHGHVPEIDIVDETTATAIWPMYDRVESPAGSGYVSHEGWGHYTETYRRCDDGRWRICRSRLSRIERHELPKQETGVTS
ncbi:nuclear transport factor 2 family protein [Rhodococcus pseudokoreensis]|uniref:Nuclear transport factor 2 family protein n=1 Tax=Rhodococcus pseudokoreensis TaxID=2811421 RepID=A0A974ZW39_9NOCA|nr:nuclear transport factor 2 family protein [Rhodococcus pseudokoreensis]QSE92082.1 nuclear transport factor 2 family protein [Rhodococcus pseudokoreensis]